MADALSLRIGLPKFGFRMGNHAFTNYAINSGTLKLAYVLQARGSEPIAKCGFRYGAKVGSTTPSYRASLQGLSSTGTPDGTIKGGGSPVSVTFTPPSGTSWDGTWRELTFDNAYTPSGVAEILAIVIEPIGGTTPDGSNHSTFTRHVSVFGGAGFRNIPYTVLHNGVSWSKQDVFGMNVLATLVTANTVQGLAMQDHEITGIATAGHRQAMRFMLPSSLVSTYSLYGIRGGWDFPPANGSAIFGIWNAAGTLLTGITYDGDYTAVSAGLFGAEVLFDDSPVTLDADTEYFAGIERVGTHAAVLGRFNLGTSSNLKSHPGGGNFYYATWDGSAWSTDQTKLPELELLLNDWAVPAGGGGDPFPSQGLQSIESGISV